jgi:thioesterase domain-containing protein
MTLDEITAYLHAHIPLTRGLAAAARRWDGASLVLGAPLAPNLNHRQTAFGGSLSAVAILAGWGVVHLALRERGLDARVVIQRSAMEFVAPAAGDFAAAASVPEPRAWERFVTTLRRHGRARVAVAASVTCGGVLVASHEGTYAALGPGPV